MGSEDVFGDEMNLACKIGEDMADQGEILLTEGAYRGLKNKSRSFEELRFNMSGLPLTAYRLGR